MWYYDAMLLWDELEEHPPVRIIFAAFAGYKSKKKEERAPLFAGGSSKAEDFVALQFVGHLAPMPKAFKESIVWAEEQKKMMFGT